VWSVIVSTTVLLLRVVRYGYIRSRTVSYAFPDVNGVRRRSFVRPRTDSFGVVRSGPVRQSGRAAAVQVRPAPDLPLTPSLIERVMGVR
jgi:hypothetical protein